MYDFDQEPERRHLFDESGLNSFLSKIYGYMALAVFVSALSAYLTMTVFARQMVSLMLHHPWTMWLLLLIPIVLTFAINFQATRNPVASFILLMITAIYLWSNFCFYCRHIYWARYCFCLCRICNCLRCNGHFRYGY